MDKNALGNPCEKHSPFPQFVGECRRVKLNEICSKGKSSLRQKDVTNDGPYSVYGASGVVGTTSDYQNEIPYVAVIKDGAGVGRASACEPMTSVLGTMQALIPNPNVERDYLLYLVRSLRLDEGFSGSTIPHIYFKDYGKIEVPLPSLEAQKRIVSQLGLIEAQIEQAEAQITQLDQLVKSRFVEMFGDCHCEKKSIGDLVYEMHIGPFGSAMKSDAFVSEEEAACVVYEQKHAIKQSIDLGWRYVDAAKKSELKRFAAGPGTILVSCRGTIGKVFQLPDNAPIGIIHPSVMKIEIDESKLNGVFFSFLLEKLFAEAETRAVGSGVKMAIKAKDLASTEIEYPPIQLQQEFAAFVAQVDKLRFETQQQIEKLETLKKSLMQEYFG